GSGTATAPPRRAPWPPRAWISPGPLHPGKLPAACVVTHRRPSGSDRAIRQRAVPTPSSLALPPSRLPHSRLADACSPQRGSIDRPSPAAVQQNAVNRHGRHGGDAVAGCLLPAFVRSAAFPQVIDPHLTARARQGTDKTHDLRAHRTASREDFNASLYGYHRPTPFSPP